MKGSKPGKGKWKDSGIRVAMHNGIHKAIQDIAFERGWRLYTPGDLVVGGIHLPGFGGFMLPGANPMLGPGGPPPGWG